MNTQNKPKIFLVEDNADIREIYRLRFEVSGFEVRAAGDGLNFISQVTDYIPDIVLLDIMMPEMDGYEALAAMRNNCGSTIAAIPVVIWSNLSQDEDMQKAMKAGANYYLRKSDYEGDDLVEKVKDILHKK
jgi:CheY-like chemotaxis protein